MSEIEFDDADRALRKAIKMSVFAVRKFATIQSVEAFLVGQGVVPGTKDWRDAIYCAKYAAKLMGRTMPIYPACRHGFSSGHFYNDDGKIYRTEPTLRSIACNFGLWLFGLYVGLASVVWHQAHRLPRTLHQLLCRQKLHLLTIRNIGDKH